ncbi:MAG: hypothetical protein E7436_00855 [Ruminococcaceae bacterium]|nr:hypothetical protein [Oscillospiraceae bacterium]
MKKLICILLSLALVLAMAACTPDTDPTEPQNPTTGAADPTEPAFSVAGSYKYDPGDQNGLGVEYMLHEDGTYYMDEFTSVVSIGTYTVTEGSGNDENGNKILAVVTFDFDAEGVSHNVIEKEVDGVKMTYLCGIYCSLSLATYDLAKLGTDLEETLATVADFYSANYAEDGIHVSVYTDYSYVLDGIYGAAEAGSMGTFTKELTANGTVYTMTEEETGNTFTLTLGETVTLSDGTSTYAMTDKDPTAQKEAAQVFTGALDGWFAVTLTCFTDGTFELTEGMADGSQVFATAKGTYEFAADYSKFTFTFEDGSVLECPTADYATWSGEYTLLTVGYTSAPTVTVSWTNAG